MFKRLDRNNDGVLQREELLEGFRNSNVFITKEDLERLVEQIDSNHNNAIDYTEFVTAAMQRN